MGNVNILSAYPIFIPCLCKRYVSKKVKRFSNSPHTHGDFPSILRRSSPSHYYFTVLLLLIKVKVRGYLPLLLFTRLGKEERKALEERILDTCILRSLFFFFIFWVVQRDLGLVFDNLPYYTNLFKKKRRYRHTYLTKYPPPIIHPSPSPSSSSHDDPSFSLLSEYLLPR